MSQSRRRRRAARWPRGTGSFNSHRFGNGAAADVESAGDDGVGAGDHSDLTRVQMRTMQIIGDDKIKYTGFACIAFKFINIRFNCDALPF
jgi:hypothetical protein